MKPLSLDTTVEMQRKHYELMRRLSPSQRLSMAFELTNAGRKLILADLRHRFPGADESEIRRRFIARVLPRADVIRAYGFDPRAEGFWSDNLNKSVSEVAQTSEECARSSHSV